MNPATTPGDETTRGRVSVRMFGQVLGQALRHWRWADTGLGLAIGLLCLLYMGGPVSPGGLDKGLAGWLSPLAYNVLQFGLPLVLGLRVADRAIERGARPLTAYVTVVLVVVVGGVFVSGPLLMPVLGSDPQWTLANDLWLAVGIGGVLALGVGGYAQWRGSQRALARALQAETARARAQQQLQAARLLALRARVDPQLLFDTLGRVEAQLTAGDPRAEHELAELTALLRRLLDDTVQATGTDRQVPA